MSEILRANKRSNYFNRKRNNKNRNRNDSDNGSSSNATNYQRLLSNSSKIDSKNYTSQLTPIILQYRGDTNVLPWVDRTGTILLAKYGNSAKFFFGDAYKRDRPTLNVYDETNDPSGILRLPQDT